MCSSEACLAYLLLVIIAAFAALIYFLLLYRKKLFEKNNQLQFADAWEPMRERAAQHSLKPESCLFGIWQDKTLNVGVLFVKNSQNQVVAEVEYSGGARNWNLTISGQKYTIEHPLVLSGRIGYLKKTDGSIVATYYRGPSSLIKHEFRIPDVGVLIAKGPRLSLLYPFDYYLKGQLTGITQAIHPIRTVGHIVAMPESYPLEVRVFILAINASHL